MKKLFFGLIATVLFSNFSFSQSNKETELIMSVDAVKLGQMHNEVLGALHKVLKENPSLTLKDALLQLNLPLTNDERIAIYDYISINKDVAQNYMNVLKSLKSENAKIIYKDMNTSIENSNNYSLLVKDIDDKLKIANSQLSGVDLKVVQIFAETSKASANYWYNIYQSNTTYNKSNWIRKDGNGIAQASIGWAVIAAASSGPAAPWTYFGSLAVGGALASIWPD